MKTTAILTTAVLVALACGCDKPKEVSGAEFAAMLKRNPESMRVTRFVGVRGDGMALLKVSQMSLVNKSKWTDAYYVTAVTNLPKDFPYPLPVPAPAQPPSR